MHLYDRLLAAYGPQGWWPASDPFEIAVGAILTQRTAWRNASLGLQGLRDGHALSIESISSMPVEILETLIRPAGFHRAKAAALRCLAKAARARGGLARFLDRETDVLREDLLSIRGIGPETADAILLYAANRASFVVDAYTHRLLERLGWLERVTTYETVRRSFMQALPPDAALFGEYHALIVRHGKEHCRTRPICEPCPVGHLCRWRWVSSSA